jgi:hypothetical protein
MSEDGFVIAPEVRKIIVDADQASPSEPFGQIFARRFTESLAVALQPQMEELNRVLAELASAAATRPLQAALRQMAESNNVFGPIGRQQDAMAAISKRVHDAMISDLLTAPELAEAGADLQNRLPRTPEQAEEVVEHAVAEATSDPEKGAVIYRIISSLKQVDLSALHPWPLILLIYLVVLNLNVADVNAFLATIAIWVFFQNQNSNKLS